MNANEKDVVVLIGSARSARPLPACVGSGRHIVLADLKQNMPTSSPGPGNTGFTTSTWPSIFPRSSILGLIDHAQQFGAIKYHQRCRRVAVSGLGRNDLERRPLRYGRLIEEFGKVIEADGSGHHHFVPVRSSPSPAAGRNGSAGHDADGRAAGPSLSQSHQRYFEAHQYSNAATSCGSWPKPITGKAGATVNSISPGIVITPWPMTNSMVPEGRIP